MHMRRLIYGLALVLLFGAVPGWATPLTGDGCVENPTGQLGCTKAVTVPDQNPTAANFTTTYGNNANLTPDPSCANTLAGGWGIEDVNEGATRHFVQCVNQAPAQDLTNPTYYFTSANEVVATAWHNPAGVIARIDLLPESTSKPDEGNPAVTGTMAWALAQFAAVPTAPVIALERGTYFLGTTLTVRNVSGGSIGGQGPYSTVILWIGNNRDPAFLLDDVLKLRLHDFLLKGTANPTVADCTGNGTPNACCTGAGTGTCDCSAVGCQLWDGVVMINGTAGTTTTATSRIIDNVWIDGNTTGLLHGGFTYAAPNSDACTGDKAPNWICSAADTFATAAGHCCTNTTGGPCGPETCDRDAGVGGGGTPCTGETTNPTTAARNSCVMGINANNDVDHYSDVRVTNGMRSVDCTASGVPAACCTSARVGTCDSSGWRIGPDQSVAHVLENSGGNHLRTCVTTQTAEGAGGNFHVHDGGCSNASYANFAVASPNRAIVIDGVDSEGSQAELRMGGPSGTAGPISLNNLRFSTNGIIDPAATCAASGDPQECCTGANAGATCGDVVSYGSKGPFTIENSVFTDASTAKPVRMVLDSTGSAPFTSAIARANVIRSSLAASAIFATGGGTNMRWTLENNIQNDGTATLVRIPDTRAASLLFDPVDGRLVGKLDLSGLPTPAAGQTPQAVIRAEKSARYVLEGVTVADTPREIFPTTEAIKVLSVGCHCTGSCSPTLAQFGLANRAGTAMTITGTNPTCSTGNGTTTFAAVTANNTVAANDAVRWVLLNTPTPGDTYTVTFSYIGQ